MERCTNWGDAIHQKEPQASPDRRQNRRRCHWRPLSRRLAGPAEFPSRNDKRASRGRSGVYLHSRECNYLGRRLRWFLAVHLSHVSKKRSFQFQHGPRFISPAKSQQTQSHVQSTFFKFSSSSTPSGSTITQPFVDRPVMSNSTTEGSANAPS